MSFTKRDDDNTPGATSTNSVTKPSEIEAHEKNIGVEKRTESRPIPKQEESKNAPIDSQRSVNERKSKQSLSVNVNGSWLHTTTYENHLVNGEGNNTNQDNGPSVMLNESPAEANASNTTEANQPTNLQHESNSSVAKEQVVATDSVDTKVTAASDRKAPSSTEKSKHEKKIVHTNFYATLSPLLAFHKISPLQNDNVQVVGLQSPSVLSKQRLGLSFEIGIQRQLAKNIEVFAGLSCYQQNQTIRYDYIDPTSVDVTDSQHGSFTVVPRTVTKEFDYKMFNVGFATGAFYQIKGDKLMHKVGAGFQYQQGLLKGGGEDSYYNAQSRYLQYQLMYRLEMPITPKLNFYLQPVFNHTFKASEKLSEPFTIRPSRAGIGVGIVYHF
jgi:hypothetical protein